MSGLSENWIPLKADHASTKADIDALRVVCENIANLYTFWCNHLGFCPAERVKHFNRKLDLFRNVFLEVPIVEELVFEEKGPRGVVQYINKDYFESPGNIHHKMTFEFRLTEVWRVMTEMHAEVSKEWMLTGKVQAQYDALRETAFASVCDWLKIPSFNGLIRREETGSRVASQATHKPRPAHSDRIGVLLQRLRECV
jgi:hypothetical protein